MNRYKYYDESRKHLHTLDGKPLMGTSAVSGSMKSIPPWYAAGFAVQTLGVPDYKVLGKIKSKKASNEEVEKLYEGVRETLEYIKGLELEAYISLLDKAYRAHDQNKKDKADKGTDRHAILEEYVKLCITTNKGEPLHKRNPEIQKFIDWSVSNVSFFIFSESNCYSENLWIGGIADCGAKLKSGKQVIIDFKSSVTAYPDQFLQCALYDIQIRENGCFDREGNQTLKPISFDGYLVVPFGAEDITPIEFWDTETARNAATAAVIVYKFNQLFAV